MENQCVCRGWKNWDREVVWMALSSGLGEGFLARQWAGGGKLKGAEKMNVSRSL